MTRNFRFPALLAVLLATALGATAQSQPQSAPAPKPKTFFFAKAGPGSEGERVFTLENIIGGFGDQEVVTNAPFSAQVVRETMQTLADGNRIARKESGTIARDSYGRTRREISLFPIGFMQNAKNVSIISIHDPVAGENYFLDAEKKTAMEMAERHRGARHGMKNMMREGLGQSESLGTKTMDGISVQGTRYTRTIPAGKIGNEKPIVITEEKWVSPDLHVTVSMTRSDPRFGTSTYQLTNINRSEPSAALFQVPNDYRIVQGKRMTIRRDAHPPDSQF